MRLSEGAAILTLVAADVSGGGQVTALDAPNLTRLWVAAPIAGKLLVL